MLLSIFTILSIVFSVWRILVYFKNSDDAINFFLAFTAMMSLLSHMVCGLYTINQSVETIAYLRTLKKYPSYDCGFAERCNNVRSQAEAEYRLEEYRIGFYGFIVRTME